MRSAYTIVVLSIMLLSFTAPLTPAQSTSPFEGVWSGGWEAGKIKLTISRDSAGKLAGKLWVSPDNGGEYTTGFSEFVVEGKTMRAKYDTPDSDPGEVQLEANLEGDTLQGTWQFKAKNKDESERGIWKARRL